MKKLCAVHSSRRPGSASLFLLAALACGFARAPAYADFTLNFDSGNTFAGTAPAGSLSVSFLTVDGGVELTIVSSLVGNEQLDPRKALYLNFNPSKDVTKLSFALLSSSGLSKTAKVLTGSDKFKAGGLGGKFDILLTYKKRTQAFREGESQTYLITSSDGAIEASDFEYLSDPQHQQGGGLEGAVHVQNTGDHDSGWVGGTSFGAAEVPTPVPVPPTAIMAMVGMASLGLTRLRRFRR